MNTETRICSNCRQEFLVEPDDFTFYEKIKVPPPTFCPKCRLIRRMMWRNERTLYRRKCDLCGKSIISVYDVDAPFPVYCPKCWWGDGWDPYRYGSDYDLGRSFLEQFKDLMNKVPMLALQNDDGIGSVNSAYATDFCFSKNVYFSSAGWYCENVWYSYYTCYDKEVMDCYMVNNSELCYECFGCDRCFNCSYSQLLFDSNFCSFSYDLKNCSNCVLCVGLRNKSYCIENVQYDKGKFKEKVDEMKLNTRVGVSVAKARLEELKKKYPRRFALLIQTVNSTGEWLFEGKFLKESFFVIGPAENSKYVVNIDQCKDCYDVTNTGKPNLSYDSLTPDECYLERFSVFSWRNNQVDYSVNCHDSQNLFGCIAIRQGEYVILNKKYSKEDFLKLKEKIIREMTKRGEWGEFFPMSLSSFGYNETQAYEYFPLTQEEAVQRSLKWKDRVPYEYAVTLAGNDVPEDITRTDQTILEETIGCIHGGNCTHKCSTAFRLTDSELGFCRKMSIPLPNLCPNCRHYGRLKFRNPLKLWHRRCQCAGTKSDNGIYQNTSQHSHGTGECPNEFETSYAPGREEIIYCEECYQKEIV